MVQKLKILQQFDQGFPDQVFSIAKEWRMGWIGASAGIKYWMD